MVATVESQVEIDDRIREQPMLLEAVTQATEYLRAQIESVPGPAVIRWRLVPKDAIELTVSDTADLSEMVARRVFPTSHMSDPYRRDITPLRVFGELLGARSRKNLAEINELARNIDYEAFAEAYSKALKRSGASNS